MTPDDALTRLLDATNRAMSLLQRGQDVRMAAQLPISQSGPTTALPVVSPNTATTKGDCDAASA